MVSFLMNIKFSDWRQVSLLYTVLDEFFSIAADQFSIANKDNFLLKECEFHEFNNLVQLDAIFEFDYNGKTRKITTECVEKYGKIWRLDNNPNQFYSLYSIVDFIENE